MEEDANKCGPIWWAPNFFVVGGGRRPWDNSAFVTPCIVFFSVTVSFDNEYNSGSECDCDGCCYNVITIRTSMSLSENLYLRKSMPFYLFGRHGGWYQGGVIRPNNTSLMIPIHKGENAVIPVAWVSLAILICKWFYSIMWQHFLSLKMTNFVK